MDAKIKGNIKMLIIGLLLLGISFTYLNTHPGEQQSFVPSLKTLVQQGELLGYKLMGADTKSLEIKQQLNKIYTELGYLIKSSDCADELVSEITRQQQHIKTMNNNELRLNQSVEITHAQELKDKIDKECVSKFSTTNSINNAHHNDES